MSPFSGEEWHKDDRHNSDAEEFKNESQHKDFNPMEDAAMSMEDFV